MTQSYSGLQASNATLPHRDAHASESFQRTRRHRKIVVRLLKSVANLQARVFELQSEKKALEYIVSEQAKHIEALGHAQECQQLVNHTA